MPIEIEIFNQALINYLDVPSGSLVSKWVSSPIYLQIRYIEGFLTPNLLTVYPNKPNGTSKYMIADYVPPRVPTKQIGFKQAT